MKNSFWIGPTLFFILLSQVVYALIIGPMINQTDIFPFHQWALFAKVNRTEELPIIYIRKIGTKEFSPPISYYDHFPMRGPVDFLVAHDNLMTWQKLEKEGNNDKALDVRRSIESHLWPNIQKVEYEIRIVKIDLINFIKRRDVEKLLQTFGPYSLQEGSFSK
jgi:hypothetical protein